jgi:Sel1 repeat
MLGRKKSEKRLRERIDSLLPDSEILVAETSPPSTHAPRQSSQNLLTLRDSVLRVVGVLDQLLTMETLIYFVQSLIELFVLSFQFAYQQPSVAAHQFSIPTRLRQSFRRNKSTRQHPQPSPSSAERVPPRPVSSPLSYLSAPVFTKTPVDRASQTSGTGSSCFSPRQPPRHVPTLINPHFPPPPSLPKLPPSFQLARIAAQSLPAQAPVIVDQPTAPVSEQTPSSRSASKSPPRRKPVASGHVRKGSAKFDRPVLNSLEPSVVSASTPSRATTQSPAGQPQLPGPAIVQPKVTIEPAAVPRLVRKSSAKLIRPPLTNPDADKHDPSSEPSSIISSEAEKLSKKKAAKKSTRDSSTKQKPLVRKSSAKFIRPPIAPQPSLAKVDPDSNQEPTSKSGSIDPEKEEHRTSTQAPQLATDTPKLLDRTADVLHTEQPKQPQIDKKFAAELPQHATSSVALVEPIPQKPTRSNLSLFPPRPAIAVLHPQAEAVDSPIADIASAFSSFPELPSLAFSFPRQPPPPPSIPRFPSPTKAPELATSPPVRSDSVNSSIERPQSKSSLTEDPMDDDTFPTETSLLPDIHTTSPGSEESSPSRPLEPSPASLRSDGPTLSTLHSSTPEIPQKLPPAVFPREWNPSEEEIAFEQQTQNVSRAVIATTPERRFSFHGSIESESPPRESSPPPESKDRLSSSHLSDRPRHSRAVSTNSQYIPSPLPSPRARPHSAGSVSSGSEYVPPQFLFDNTHLKPGNAAALLSHAETLNLYRQNAKKAVDNPAIQYEFAIFMMDAARESTLDLNSLSPTQRDELTKEALSILRRLADRGYPQAQYYLADCYTNGIGCKHNNPDLEKAFPLFVLAAKHGHVEASFRAALAYENAWGCRRDPLKALQFYR